MTTLNQVRALSRIRRALIEAETEVAESEREYFEAGGSMSEGMSAALQAFHARVRIANGLVTAHTKTVSDAYDDQKTPARTPSALMRAVESPERVEIKTAFENSVELVRGNKRPV